MSRLKADWPVDVHRCRLRGPRRRSRKKEEEWQSPERQAFPHGGRRSRWKMSKVQTPLRGEVSTILNASYWMRAVPGTSVSWFRNTVCDVFQLRTTINRGNGCSGVSDMT